MKSGDKVKLIAEIVDIDKEVGIRVKVKGFRGDSLWVHPEGIMTGRLFTQPAGPSKRRWNNVHWASDGDILCEACGTPAPKDAKSSIVDRIFGFQLVEECCGKTIDVLYEELGEEFCQAFLEDFAKDPTNPQFSILKMILKDLPKKLRVKAKKTNESADSVEQITSEIS